MFDPTVFDRFAIGFSLGIHILLVMFGIAIPVIILLADYLWVRNGDKAYKTLSSRLLTVFAILFAVGAASGALVAIELLVLWPKFMALVGQVAISTLNVEVIVFFMETIFLVAYLFYRDTFSNKNVRLVFMLFVAVGSALSGVLITLLNAFMNTPVGFNIQAYLQNGTVTDVHPFAVLFASPSGGIEVPHVLSAVYFAGSVVLMAYFSLMLMRSRDEIAKEYYRKALRLAFAVCLVAAAFAIITGILSIENLRVLQPEKYAAIELNLNSIANAPEIIGGTIVNGSVRGAIIAIPGLQSMLAGVGTAAVPGLAQFPQSTWPPLFIHPLFDVMVMLGFAMGGFLALVLLLHIVRVKALEMRVVQLLLVLVGLGAVLLLEIGWVVDEVGRQPWIIYNVMTVSQAANQSAFASGLALLIVIAYAVVLPATYLVIRKVFSKRPLTGELEA